MAAAATHPAILISLGALGLLAGCADPDSAVGFNEKAPEARIRAIRQAGSDRNEAAIPDLINLLESDDPAERLLAIRTLERLTGQTLGYDHAATREDRQVAVQAWANWYQHHAGAGGASSKRPTPSHTNPPGGS